MRLPFISSRLVSNLLFLSLSLLFTLLVFIDLEYTYGMDDPDYFYRQTGVNLNGASLNPFIEIFRLLFPAISFSGFLLIISTRAFFSKESLTFILYWLGFYVFTFYFAWLSFGLGMIICGGLGALLINNTIEKEKKPYPNWIIGLSGSILGLVGLILVLNGSYFDGGGLGGDDTGKMYLAALLPWQIGIGIMLVLSNSASNNKYKVFPQKVIGETSKLKWFVLLFLLFIYFIIILIS